MTLSFPSSSVDVGLEVTDIRGNEEFLARNIHLPNPDVQMERIHRIVRAFVQNHESILQELVDAAVILCGADSAGISIEKEDRTEAEYFQWVATSGQYSPFLDAVLPRYPSACTICLDRGGPQHFRVTQTFFDLMGIEAPLVTDGLLLPWEVGTMRGTIFIMAHGRTEAFDHTDLRMMLTLADFAAVGIRLMKQQAMLVEQASAAGAAAMAHNLAHKINNPLQSLTNILYLLADGRNHADSEALGRQAFGDLGKLSTLVQNLLGVPLGQSA